MTTIHVTASREYDVLVQPGLLVDAGAQIARTLGTGRTAAGVAGETVAGLYAARLEASLTRAGFRVVTFVYPGGEEAVLRDISFEVKKGETIAFIGSTGSGKSTLVSLLPRFNDVRAGAERINGVMDNTELSKKIQSLMGLE